MICKKNHSDIQTIMENLPIDQGRKGRHKCAACTYEIGFQEGYELKEKIDLGNLLDSLDESQAKAQRHKSPHAAYVQGYLDGVKQYYAKK